MPHLRPTSPEYIYHRFLDSGRATTDSRKIEAGSIFFALKGENFDGNAFALQAIENGAEYAVIDDPACARHDRLLYVESVLETLQQLANHHRRQYNIPVIAITGTNGKTTTKELIHAVLSEKYTTLSTRGNLNNHIGVPLTLLEITASTQMAVIEMGANHPGEIDLLCRIAEPDYGLITNIGKAHLEGFGGYEGVIRTKTEMYRFLKERNGSVFVNFADPLLMKYAGDQVHIGYGTENGRVSLKEILPGPYASASIEFSGNHQFTLTSQLIGDYNIPNILAAACVGDFFGVPAASVVQAISGYTPRNNRSQIKQTENNTLILDAYNANPTSMAAALDSFFRQTYPSRMVILGDMLELGEVTDEEHLKILKFLEANPSGEVFLVGPVFTRINTCREFICFDDSELARLWFMHHKPKGKTILIKGSRGIKLEKVAEIL